MQVKLSQAQLRNSALIAAGIKPSDFGARQATVRMQDKKKKKTSSERFIKALYY